ncbi:Hsp70 family protein [Actinomycetospora sp. NBC_00405]|uniref:Hsp70 family protein n=1 Tax=Actinomycetospora sp. NBC_00405 TaxID=2975952 RepID=UPI002E1C3CA5
MPDRGRRVYGIDLGTTYSAVGFVDETGRASIARNGEGEETTPSVVYLESPTNVVVGTQAKAIAKIEPDHVVSLVKRQMGTSAVYSFHGQEHTPESLSALILKHLAAGAEVDDEVRDVVITVPAYFGMRERDATRKAGEIAGLEVLGIVPEPVAAAVHYETSQGAVGRTVLVYDLGGGTFDTSVIRIDDNAVDVVCTDGDKDLGGADWDARLAEHLMTRFVEEAAPDEDPRESEDLVQEVALLAESVKKQLSKHESRPVNLKLAGAAARFDVTRAEFEAMTEDLLDTTVAILRRTLDTLEDKSPGTTIDEVLLVGGSTRMPAVAERLAAEFGWTPRLFEPDLAVAKGAAIWALSRRVVQETARARDAAPTLEAGDERAREALSAIAAATGMSEADLGRLSAKSTRNVLSKAFGVQLVDGPRPDDRVYVHHLVAANDPLPTGDRTLEAFTVVAGQRSVDIALYEQAGTVASEEMEDNVAVSDGAGRIEGIPPGPAGAPVDIVLGIDEQGLLRLRATHRSSGRSLDIAVTIGALSPEEVERATRVVHGLMVTG